MKMCNIHRQLTFLSVLLFTAVLLQACGRKSSPSMAAEHVQGTVQSVDAEVLTVATPAGSVRVQLAPSTRVATVVHSDRAHITDGSFLGITFVTDPDGSQRAVEVLWSAITPSGGSCYVCPSVLVMQTAENRFGNNT